MPLCANCGEDNPGRARFCLACGSPLEAAPPPPPPTEERKVITAVFTDIVGSTAAAEELDPEDVQARLSPYYARLRSELERHGGTVEKFIGDAVVAVFGAPVAHEDDAERAVRAALAIRDAIDELNAKDAWLDLKIRTAVHTGEALVLVGADALRGEGVAAGDVMNTAARLQSAAAVNGIVVGAETFRATRRVIEYRALDPVPAKGKAEPVPVWEVVGARDEAADEPARAPLVGRAEETERLWAVWDEVRNGREPAVATVVGNPGVGKTRLLREFTERARADARVLCGRCLSYGEGITYWPVTEVVKDAAGILQSDGTEAISGKLGAFLEELGTSDAVELRTIASAVSNVVGVPVTPRGTYIATEITQAELHWGIARLLELVARERPLVVMIEDLHWAEPTLLELLRFIVESATDTPLLVLGSARPELLDARPAIVAGNRYRHVVHLDALTAEASEALLEELAGGAALPRRVVETVLERAAGNPLYLEEIVRMLADEGLLDGAPTDPERLEAIPIPGSLQALIGSRLDLLPAPAKRVGQHASVVGTVFWSGAVADLVEADGGVETELTELARRDLVYPRGDSSVEGQNEYAFKHVLIRDVAYGRLPKRRRIPLHVRFADWVEGLPGAGDELVEIVAYHLEQACRLAREVARSPVEPPILRAVETLRRSAEKAERREGVREADRYYARALELIGAGFPEEATELRLRRARTRVAVGELQAASQELSAVAEQALALGRRDLRCAALIVLTNTELRQGRFAESQPWLTEAEAIARTLDDVRLRVRVLYESAAVRSFRETGVDEAIAELQEALRLVESLDDRALEIEGHMRLATVFFNLGDLAGAESQLEQALALAGQSGSFRDEARATSILGRIRFYRGQHEEAEQLAQQARDWLERTGDSLQQLQNLRALAIYALARGDAELAEERLREVLPLALEKGGWMVIDVYRYLTEALVLQARLDEARDLLAFAARSVPMEGAYARAVLLVAEGKVAAAEREAHTAAQSYEEAIQIFAGQNMQLEVAETRLAYAQALRSLGEPVGARTELEQARAIVKRLGALGLLDAIDRELDELGEEAGRSGPLASHR